MIGIHIRIAIIPSSHEMTRAHKNQFAFLRILHLVMHWGETKSQSHKPSTYSTHDCTLVLYVPGFSVVALTFHL